MKRTTQRILSLLLVLCTSFSLLLLPVHGAESAQTVAESVEREEAQTIVGFGEFDLSAHALAASGVNRPTREALTARMPETLDVLLSDGSQRSIPVEWFDVCGDYEESNAYYFQFSPMWDEDAYTLADGIDLLTDAPYIGVTLYADMTGGIQAQSVCASKYAKYEEETFCYLVEVMGMNAAQACGVMANILAECSFIPNNLQDSYEKSLGYTDTTYTAAVDNGKYTRNQFKGDSAGYGLCQWTYSTRKAALYDFAKEKKASIGDLGMQLDYLNKELTQDYSSLKKTMLTYPNTAQGAYDAGAKWCEKFERPSDMEKRMKERGNKAKNDYWPEYCDFNTIIYDGTPKTPTVTSDFENYSVEYLNNVNAGTAAIVIYALDEEGEPIMDEEGVYLTEYQTFTIAPRTLTADNCKLSKTSYTYSGEACKPALTVTDVLTNAETGEDVTVKLKNKTDFTYKRSTNVEVGNHTVTVTGTGNYTGTVKLTFSIKPKETAVSSASSAKTKQLTVKWKKNTSAGGYQVQVATDSKFTKNLKKKTISKNSTTSYTFTDLKKKAKYYIRIRAYKKVGDTNFYSPWKTFEKTVKTK